MAETLIEIAFTVDELEALYHVYIVHERVNWVAYDAAKRRIIEAGAQLAPVVEVAS